MTTEHASASSSASAPILDIHATAVALGSCAALLRGPSGSGKSDLALRFVATVVPPALAASEYATPSLVADDRVVLERRGDGLHVRAHERLTGLLEVRGLGIVPVAVCPSAELVLLVDLVVPAMIERLPEPLSPEVMLGVAIPLIRLTPFEVSAPLKLALAIEGAAGRRGAFAAAAAQAPFAALAFDNPRSGKN